MHGIIDFNIKIPTKEVTHIKEKSHYNYNFYHVENYGDWLYGELDTVLQTYNECENCYMYEYGYFNDNNEFKPILCWDTNKDIFIEVI